MAHFAELDQNNIVCRVIVVGDEVLKDDAGVENEQRGIDFCKRLFGQETIWKQTSYNTMAGDNRAGGAPFRKNYAGIGYSYDAQRDAFIPPKPDEDGWTLDEEKCIWRNLEREAAQETAQIGVSRV